MDVLEHDHPLTLVDLQLEYPPYDEEEDDDDEGGGRTTKEVFHGATCKRCGEEIHMYHRYYYKCTSSTCHFSLHKFCAELPQRLDHPLHPHPLIMHRLFYNNWICQICESKHKLHEMYHRYYYKCTSSTCDFSLHKFCAKLPQRLDQHPLHSLPLIMQQSMYHYDWICQICESKHKRGEVCYTCDERDNWYIDVKCAMEVGKNTIHHPCHPHLLMCAISQPILCKCKACGKEHQGVFYQCTTCINFTIHSDCAFLPEELLIQETSHNAFHHTHPLTISYSFPLQDQYARYYPNCRVCGHNFSDKPDLWIYKCEDCMYYAHLDCATSRREPFMSILMPTGRVKNYKDVDLPGLLHLPFPDETYSVPRHLLLRQEKRDYEVSLKHASHPQHPLILVDQTHECNNGQTSSTSSLSLMCHDPMKKTQLLCNGCLRPITSTMPFYNCPHPICNFALHEWCTRLPPKIENHPLHPQHTLLLKHPNALPHFFGVFYCDVCDMPCNGFAYCCEECDDYVDVTCGFIPPKITHKAHPNHLLSLVHKPSDDNKFCHTCRNQLWYTNYYSCIVCDISIHPECALLLAETIRHKYDKHPMHLSYLPIENHKSEYFCEICEEEMNPHKSFYHCQPCAQSVHAVCAPLILQSETHTHGLYEWTSVYYFVNVKFGGILDTNGHRHPLSFAQGLGSYGTCVICHISLQYRMIFKCLKCKSAICYECCKRDNTWSF